MTVNQEPATDDTKERLALLARAHELFPKTTMNELLAVVDWVLTGSPNLDATALKRAAQRLAQSSGFVWDACDSDLKNKFRGQAMVVVTAYLGNE